MKYYIASGLENADNVRKLRDILNARGWVQTYDWTVHGSVQDTPELWRKVASDERWGVLSADLVVVLLPGGRGTHVEFGLALSQGHIRTAVIGADKAYDRTCVFYHAVGVQRFETVEDFLKAVVP